MAPTRFDLQKRKFLFSDTPFISLMKKRIYHVLLVSSVYDAFMLEEDGRIDEQIFNEYVSLNLRYPPTFILVSSEEEAFQTLSEESIDLVIIMLSSKEKQTYELAEKIKAQFQLIPIVVLAPLSRELSLKIDRKELKSIDYVFNWLGNADILLAIIKLIEDKMNAEHDIVDVGVQCIILVEDSVRFYSSYLPNIYKIIFKQSKSFMTEGLNEHQKTLRMRGRPKILLATTYEEAINLYKKYKQNLLGIISDISYEREGKTDKQAGIRLCQVVKKNDKFMPLLLQSSDSENEELAKQIKVGFINKNSKSLSIELRRFIKEFFAFGDFVFKDPNTNMEVMRAGDLKAMQERIFQVPNESLQYHIERNHLSKWLRARALFPLADLFKMFAPEDFNDCDDIKRFVFDAIATFRLNKARGVIAEFNRESFDEYLSFTRIGQGSIGGKARGLAFLDSLIKRNNLHDKYEGVTIGIPRTVVLCTDVFDEFMEENNLYSIALSDDYTDEEILRYFVEARLPFRIHEDLYTLISVIRNPLAVRSSSMLEDSHYQPFAGIYSTYMIPVVENDERTMIKLLSNAIKSVYASAFYKDSKAYMMATKNVIDEEKMAIVLQEVCGKTYNKRHYPAISGVARSINFYPIGPEKPEDGIANIALGLGKHIVDGGQTLRFSPKFPQKVLQTSMPDLALRETQKQFFALNLDPESFKISTDEAANLLQLRIADADKDGVLKLVCSTYDYHGNILRDGYHDDGKKLITFANILKYNTFPIADILTNILQVGQKEMGKPIEIEFAIELNKPIGVQKMFYVLQIRPIVDIDETIELNLDSVPVESTIIKAEHTLGNGIINNIYDFVYVKPSAFDPSRTRDIANLVGQINEGFLHEGKNYILIGPGRWGSSDPWLGIPVKWPQISAARIIIESGLGHYRIDPSQGTHFFQNLTSFGVGYFTINPFINDGFYDLEYLDAQPAFFENEFVRHIRFDQPLTIAIDGKQNKGVIFREGVVFKPDRNGKKNNS
ncbi:MAG: PEP/pyruvate-binding domain-containing protein [Bacteroidales bacterium]|nr:PEP/pyruvate-binding domain-containing protein [Bacteroidales bacterium]